MKQLAVTQFFLSLHCFNVGLHYTRNCSKYLGTTDATSNVFNEAGNWTGVIFAAYSVFCCFIFFSDYSISK